MEISGLTKTLELAVKTVMFGVGADRMVESCW